MVFGFRPFTKIWDVSLKLITCTINLQKGLLVEKIIGQNGAEYQAGTTRVP